MKIEITDEKKRIAINIPTRILFSRFGLLVIRLGDRGKRFRTLRGRDMKKIRKEIYRMRKLHKDWSFLEADSQDGSQVRINL